MYHLFEYEKTITHQSNKPSKDAIDIIINISVTPGLGEISSKKIGWKTLKKRYSQTLNPQKIYVQTCCATAKVSVLSVTIMTLPEK